MRLIIFVIIYINIPYNLNIDMKNTNRDQFVSFVVKTKQPVFVSGANIQGAVYLNTLIDRAYKNLELKLTCVEELKKHLNPLCSLLRHHQNSKPPIQQTDQRETEGEDLFLVDSPVSKINKKINFEQKVVLQEYKEYLPKGNYVYYFTLMLPTQLPGSCKTRISKFSSKIQYFLTATLTHNKGSSNYYHSLLPIEIIEAPKLPAFHQKTLNSSFCSFFTFSDNPTRVYAKVTNSSLSPNRSFNIIGGIDTRDSSSDISGISIVLIRKVFVKQQKMAKQIEKKEWRLWKGFHKLQTGILMPLDLTLLVPEQIDLPTISGWMFGVIYSVVIEIDFKGIFGKNRMGQQVIMHLNSHHTIQIEDKHSNAKIFTLKKYPKQKQLFNSIKQLVANSQLYE